MKTNAKTDNFLKAIKKYAGAQKNALKTEVKQLKEEKIADAREKAKLESEKLINDSLEKKRTQQTSILAKRTQEGQKKLFLERAGMVDEIFSQARARVIEFTKTDAYKAKLLKSAGEIAELFGTKACVIYVNEKDLALSDEILRLFGGSAEIKADASIELGGVKGWCREMSVVADETLDSKLEQQRSWFIENTSLEVV